MPFVIENGKIKPLKRTAEEVMELIEKENVEFIDLQFTDLPGRLQHTTVPAYTLGEDAFTEGVPKLDGSSIRGYTEIHESDMLLKADPSTYSVIPWIQENMKTARMLCDVYWGFGLGRLLREPRAIAQKAEQVVKY